MGAHKFGAKVTQSEEEGGDVEEDEEEEQHSTTPPAEGKKNPGAACKETDQKGGAQLTPPTQASQTSQAIPHLLPPLPAAPAPALPAGGDAAGSDAGRGRRLSGLRMPLPAGRADEPVGGAARLRRQAVRPRVHPGRHLHLRRLSLEALGRQQLR